MSEFIDSRKILKKGHQEKFPGMKDHQPDADPEKRVIGKTRGFHIFHLLHQVEITPVNGTGTARNKSIGVEGTDALQESYVHPNRKNQYHTAGRYIFPGPCRPQQPVINPRIKNKLERIQQIEDPVVAVVDFVQPEKGSPFHCIDQQQQNKEPSQQPRTQLPEPDQACQ